MSENHRVLTRVWENFGSGDPRAYTAEDLRIAIAEMEFERENLTDFEFSVLRSFKAELAQVSND